MVGPPAVCYTLTPMADPKAAPVTVATAKTTIVGLLEQLHRQGVWIRAIDIDWKTIVPAEDVETPKARLECTIKFQADL